MAHRIKESHELPSYATIRGVELEVRHLRLVAGIADAGSMTKAAERLFVTQSALSHQLRDIESRFETPFFTRPVSYTHLTLPTILRV